MQVGSTKFPVGVTPAESDALKFAGSYGLSAPPQEIRTEDDSAAAREKLKSAPLAFVGAPAFGLHDFTANQADNAASATSPSALGT